MGFLLKFIGPLTITPAITLVGLSLFDVGADYACKSIFAPIFPLGFSVYIFLHKFGFVFCRAWQTLLTLFSSSKTLGNRHFVSKVKVNKMKAHAFYCCSTFLGQSSLWSCSLNIWRTSRLFFQHTTKQTVSTQQVLHCSNCFRSVQSILILDTLACNLAIFIPQRHQCPLSPLIVLHWICRYFLLSLYHGCYV